MLTRFKWTHRLTVLTSAAATVGLVSLALAQTSTPAKPAAPLKAASPTAAPAAKAIAKPEALPVPADGPPGAEICTTASNAEDRTRPVAGAETKSVYFVNLRDGDKVRSPFRIAFGLIGMGIAPAGVKIENTGHHHLLVNQKLSMDMLTKALPFNDNYRHFGKGDTEALVTLPPGKHTLRLLFADADHKPYYVYSREITVEVLPPKAG